MPYPAQDHRYRDLHLLLHSQGPPYPDLAGNITGIKAPFFGGQTKRKISLEAIDRINCIGKAEKRKKDANQEQ